jgi:hypothetical protein
MNEGRNDHGAVLRPETLKMMATAQVQLDPHLLAMGLGFFLATWGTHRVLWHGGGQPGFRSSLYVAPDADLGVVTLTNCETAGHEQLATDLMRHLLDVPDPRLPPPGVLASPHLWSELCGYYGPGKGFQTSTLVNLSFGGEFQVYTHGTRLMLRSLAGGLEKGVVLHPLDSENPLVLGAQVSKDLVPVVFKRDATGKVGRFHLGLRHFGLYELQKYPKRSRAWYGARALNIMLRALGLAGRAWRKLSKERYG